MPISVAWLRSDEYEAGVSTNTRLSYRRNGTFSTIGWIGGRNPDACTT